MNQVIYFVQPSLVEGSDYILYLTASVWMAQSDKKSWVQGKADTANRIVSMTDAETAYSIIQLDDHVVINCINLSITNFLYKQTDFSIYRKKKSLKCPSLLLGYLYINV